MVKKIDFSGEDWDQASEIFDGVWVIANKHNPGLNRAMEVNNRVFVFRLKDRLGEQVLLSFGAGCQATIDALKSLETKTGLAVTWVVGNGGGHHLFLDLWYRQFPEARIMVPAKRVPFTRNGRKLAEKYADRWELMHGPKPEQLSREFGDQVDAVIFDQLLTYSDETHASVGGAESSESPETHVGGFKLMSVFGKITKDFSQPNDEVFFFHQASGLVIAGHNFQFIYTPKSPPLPKKFQLAMGGFPMSIMMKMMMPKGQFKSALEGQAAPIADPKLHADEWEAVLDWKIQAWTSCHNPPTVLGPDMSGEEIKAAVRESIHRSGEDDPTGARLKWNLKHK